MNIQVGDRVAFSRAESAISGHAAACFGIDFINSLAFQKCKFYKGKVTKIKTHFLFFFKLKEPIYLIDDYYVVKNVKPVKIIYAEIDKPCSNPDCITICYDCCSA